MLAIDRSIPEPIVREHVDRLAELMRKEDVGAVILFHPSNMLAFAGTAHASSDRLVCGAVTRDGEVMVVCPAFEKPGIEADTSIPAIHTWQEHEDAYAVLALALLRAGIDTGNIGVDGRTWIDSWSRLQGIFPGYKLYSGEALLREIRICKSPAELEIMQQAHNRGEQVFLKMREMVRAGVTERDLQQQVREHFAAEGFNAAPMIQTGPNGAVPHHEPDDSPLQDGHTVVVDSVTLTSGYNNDITRTYAVGEPSPRAKEAYQVVRAAQAAAIEAARPGVTCESLDKIARKVITDAGFGQFFTHRLGHGIGIECHEPPYLVGGNRQQLRPGMCMTVEPGIYIPGEFGIRIEDDIVITDDGCRVIAGELKTDITDAFNN